MNCVNCGNPLQENAKFCPKCGKYVRSPLSQTPTVRLRKDMPVRMGPANVQTNAVAGSAGVKQPDAPHFKQRKRMKAIIALICCAAILLTGVAGALIAVLGKQSDFETISNAGFVCVNNFSQELIVTDEQTALAAIEVVSELLQVTNPATDLQFSNCCTTGDSTTYAFEQLCGGIPVIEKGVNVIVDKNNVVQGITSNFAPLKQSTENAVNYDPQAAVIWLNTQGDTNNDSTPDETNESYDIPADSDISEAANVEESIDITPEMQDTFSKMRKNLQKTFQQSAFRIIDYSKQPCYYSPIQSKETTLCYEFVVGTTDSVYSVMIATQSGEVLDVSELLNTVETTIYGSSETVQTEGREKGGQFYVLNSNRQSVFDYKGFAAEDAFDIVHSQKNVFDDRQIQVMNLVSDFRDFYESLGVSLPESEHISVSDTAANGRSARGGAICVNDNFRLMLLAGENFDLNEADVLAHEYAHAFNQNIVGFRTNDKYEIPDSINEGIADIFAVLIEQKLLGLQEPDWLIGNNIRNLKDPRSQGLPVKTDEKVKTDDYAHTYSTVISNAAYNMYNGIDGNESKKIDADTLARLWLNALSWMRENVTVAQCACAVENAAKVMLAEGKLTSAQFACVKEAFGEKGIENHFNTLQQSLKNEFSVTILNQSGEKADSVQYTVSKIATDKNGMVNANKLSKVAKGTVDNGVLQLKLDDGYYLISISDNAQQSTAFAESLRIKVDGSSQNAIGELTMKTQFVNAAQTANTANTSVQNDLNESELKQIILNAADFSSSVYRTTDCYDENDKIIKHDEESGYDEFYLRYTYHNIYSWEEFVKEGTKYYTEDVVRNVIGARMKYIDEGNGLYISQGGVGFEGADIFYMYEKAGDNQYKFTEFFVDLIGLSGIGEDLKPDLKPDTTDCLLTFDGNNWVFDGEIPYYVDEQDLIAVIDKSDAQQYNNFYQFLLYQRAVSSAYYNITQSDLDYDLLHHDYLLYDINHDGVKELIIHSGTCEGDRTYHCYTYANGDFIKLGTVSGWHSALYTNKDNNLCVYGGGQGYYSLTELRIESNQLKNNTQQGELTDAVSSDIKQNYTMINMKEIRCGDDLCEEFFD